MLGLCLVALFAVSAMIAVPAMAKQTPEEKEENKIWPTFKHCPYNEPGVELCFAGITSGGKGGGFFSLGGVTVPLSKPITLQGGLSENSEGELIIHPATTETLESPELKVPGGIKLITPEFQEQAKWPAELTALWKEAIKNKESSMYVKIEVAGTKLYETPNSLNTTNLIFEEGTAFTLPLKVKMSGAFLTKLGGGTCDVGNEEHPVYQYLTTEPQSNGSAGRLHIYHEGDMISLTRNRLGDLGWEIPVGAEASGCGGSYESYVDSALNQLLGLNYTGSSRSHGLTLLVGNLYESLATTTKEILEP